MYRIRSKQKGYTKLTVPGSYKVEILINSPILLIKQITKCMHQEFIFSNAL